MMSFMVQSSEGVVKASFKSVHIRLLVAIILTASSPLSTQIHFPAQTCCNASWMLGTNGPSEIALAVAAGIPYLGQ
jgi:hypothetical protein